MVFNCAAVYKNNKINLVYRARGEDMSEDLPISRLGLAVFKNDGFTLEKRYTKPIFEPAAWYEPAGCEDPRITKLNGKYYMLYTAFLGRHETPFFEEEGTNIAMASSTDLIDWKRHGLLLPTVLEPEKNGVLFPKKIKGNYILYYRIDPDIYFTYSKTLENPKWEGHKKIITLRKKYWDSWKIGAGGPPLETKDGWLFIYHGVSQEGTRIDAFTHKERPKLIYRLGAMLVDKHNPTKILYRSENPIFEPKEKYEKEGFVPDVVFSCGAIIIKDTLYVYYGAADTVIGLATCKLSELLKKIKNKSL